MRHFARSSSFLVGLALVGGLVGCNGNSDTAAPAGGNAPAASAGRQAMGNDSSKANKGTAAGSPGKQMASVSAGGGQPVSLKCPVTGNPVTPDDAAGGKSTYNGKTYYFCCGGCKPKFDKTPQVYIANAARGKYESM